MSLCDYLKTSINVFTNSLSLGEFCADETRTPTRYDLYAVINHTGSLDSGHCELLMINHASYMSLIFTLSFVAIPT